MKIGSLPPASPVESSASQPRAAETDAVDATKVTLSKDASFVATMRDKASPQAFRPDIVAEVRAQLAAGTFEQHTDLERVVDGLLADL